MAGLWQRTGNVTVTNGSKTITGFGTKWKTGTLPIQKGHTFYGPDNAAYEVDTVVSDTEILLVDTYRGGTMANQPYRIDITRTSTISQFAADLASLVAKYRSWFDGMMTWLTGSGDVAILNPDTGANVTIPSWKKVASEGEGQTARAKVEADRAKTEADRALTEADRAAGIVATAALPLPDVWAPLSDSLRLITGYGRDVLVGSDVVARMVNFARSSTATYIGKDGLLKTAAANEPRFEKEGLLVEGQSTNIVTNSNVFTPYGAGATKVDNQPGPFGANDATRIDTVNPYQGTNPPLSASLVDGSVYTSSVWLRGAVGGEKIRIGIHNSTTGLQVTLTTEWKRYSITQTRNAGTNAAFVIQAESAPVSFFVYGAQLEALPFASSYIPTAGAAVTRAADVCWIPMAGNSDNRMSFALAISGFKSVGPGITSRALWYEFDMSGPYFGARYRDGEILAAHGMSPAGATIYSTGLSGFPAATIAISPGIKSRFGQYTATQKVDSSPLKTSPGNLHIGSFKTPGQELWGHVRNLRIWHRVLTEEQIKAVA